MKLEYLQTAEPGARWMRQYYKKNPQLDFKSAVASLQKTENLLQEHPMSGTLFEDYKNVRQFPVRGTSFSLLYTVKNDTIWIIDIRDQRGMRSAKALRLFTRELRERFRLL